MIFILFSKYRNENTSPKLKEKSFKMAMILTCTLIKGKQRNAENSILELFDFLDDTFN